MDISGKDPKNLKGTVVNGHSGISVTLPADWYAVYYSHGMLGIFSKEDCGLFTFSVFPLTDYKSPDPDFSDINEEKEEEKDTDGIFSRYMVEHENKSNNYMVWETETKKYRITFTYQGPPEDFYKEMPAVRKIIHSIKIPGSS